MLVYFYSFNISELKYFSTNLLTINFVNIDITIKLRFHAKIQTICK